MKAVLKELKNQILSLLFSIVLTYWAMTSFFGMPIIETLLVISLLNTFLFVGFICVRKKGIAGSVLFLLGSAAYFMGIIMVIALSGNTNTSYLIWVVLTKPESVEFIPEFWLVTILFASYGFSSTVYYFTNARYRIAALMLIGIIPFMLQAAKTDKGITLPFIFFTILFFALYVERTVRKSVDIKKGYYINNPWYVISLIFFVASILILSFITPKPETIPKIAYLNSVINQTIQNLGQTNGDPFQGQNLGNLFNPMNLKSQSYLDSNIPPLGNRVLFEVKASEPLYFRIQSWDKYEGNRWLKGDKTLERSYLIEDRYRNNKLSLSTYMLNLMNQTGSIPSEYSSIGNALTYASKPQEIKKATIYTKGVSMQIFLNPPGVFEFDLRGKDKSVYVNEHGVCFLENNRRLNINEEYTVSYFSQHIAQTSSEFNIVRELNSDLVSSLLNPKNYKVDNDTWSKPGEVQKGERIRINSQTLEAMEEANNEMDMAYEKYTGLPEDLPKRISDLAKSITAGLTSDYDKAAAIQSFFHTSEFIYDLTPPSLPIGRDYNDFFIFESKRGVCIHFASAMVIMARAAGLPARYVEGFIADEWNPETGLYLIREKHAHAFPEVYIAGYGWMVFEPTVGLQDSDSGFGSFFGDFFEAIRHIAARVLGFLSVMPVWVRLLFIPYTIFSFMILIWIFIRVSNNFWEKRILKADSSEALSQVFARTTSLLRNIGLGIEKYETPANYSLRIFEASGVTLSELAESFNKSKYGGVRPSLEDVSNAVKKHMEVRRYVKRKVGKLRSWRI